MNGERMQMGDIVIVVGVYSGGGGIQPAIVTQVYEPKVSDIGIKARLNVTVFADGQMPGTRQSLPCYPSLYAADQLKAVMPFCYPKGMLN